jgi:cytochrome P450
MTDEELWEDVHDVMGAGHETTATTLASALYCISAHPRVEAKVVAEMQRVLGAGPAPVPLHPVTLARVHAPCGLLACLPARPWKLGRPTHLPIETCLPAAPPAAAASKHRHNRHVTAPLHHRCSTPGLRWQAGGRRSTRTWSGCSTWGSA